MSAEQKAVTACANYVRLHMEIKRLTLAIGQALENCQGVAGRRRYTEMLGDIPVPCIDESDPTHLKEAYTPDVCNDDVFYLDDAEVREQLAVCPHCLAAHGAIQARKAARKSLGAAKRVITMIGRRAGAL